MAEIVVCALEDLPPGEVRIVHAGEISVGVYNLGGELFALEDRCSHDDGPLCEGDFDLDEGYAVCPRHGARIDIRSGRALTLPAVMPVETFRVRVDDGLIKVELA
ncbi:MAG: non-heme iron oxygenase ferredoxin subunit [Actinobacteria bacterium]|nr:non-heme iron oxygenase ferredoxin subunit [Actinomycetota bacterium]